jgi:regulator of cell morphogenesis and NO signaling
MSRFDCNQSVASIVAEAPLTAAVFERHGIDFCCGGKVPVADACARKGVEAERLLVELEQAAAQTAPDQRNWAQAPLVEVLDQILGKHHAYVKAEVPRLSQLVAKVNAVHGAAHPESIPELARLWQRLAGEISMHLRKEEEILFPALRELALGRTPQLHCGVESPMRVMEMEHDEHGYVLGRMRALTQGYAAPPEACGSWRALYGGLAAFEADLHRHVHLENNVLFPRVREQLERGGGCCAHA